MTDSSSQAFAGCIDVVNFLPLLLHQTKEEGSVPCLGQPELAYKGKSSALVTGFVLAEGTHQTRYLLGELHSI